jgi:hypothetical protein
MVVGKKGDMNYRKLAIKELRRNGYRLKRNGAKQYIYFNPETKSMIPLKRHDFDKSDLRYIRKEIDQERGR